MTAELISALGLEPSHSELKAMLSEQKALKAQLQLSYHITRAPFTRVQILETKDEIKRLKAQIQNLS